MKSQAPAAEAPPPEAPGKTAVRLFAGFAGFGAASVNLAVSSSLFAATGTGPRLTPLALAAALWGATLLAWTVAALRNGNFPMPRVSAAALPAAAAVHVLAIVTGARGDTAGLGLSHLAALLLTLMIIAATAWLGRQPSSDNDGGSAGGGTAGGGGDDEGGRPATGGTSAARLVAAAFAGALAVAAITTPGLAASTAGQFAVPHGSHSGGAAGHHGP